MFRKLLYLSAVGLILAGAGGASAQDLPGQVMFDYWFGGGVDNNLDNLKVNPNFPDAPQGGALLATLDHPDWDGMDYWGARGRAYLTPPADGDYTFWVASDDDSELYLSTDDNPANAVMIASVEGWTAYQDYLGSVGSVGDNTISDPIPLKAGQRYYVELLFSDGTGGGHASVAWGGPEIGEGPVTIASDYVATNAAWTAPLYWSRNPSPADGAVDVTSPLFTWEGGKDIVMYDLYLGTTPDLGLADYVGIQPVALYYHLAGLTPGQTYYWRADGIDAATVVHESLVWSFTVMPAKASEPYPPTGVANAPLVLTLGWKAGQAAQQHAVYFGTDEAAITAGDPNLLVATVAETSFQLPALDLETQYFWRVDEVGPIETVAGDVWSFATVGVIEPAGEPNLVGWWTFDTEPANSMVALDMTGNGHHGMLKGDISFVDDFYMGPALKLPGGSNQFVDIGPVGISGNDATTIACWAKADHTNIPDWTLVFGFTGTDTGAGGNGSHFNIGSLGGPGGVGAHCWGWEETIFNDQEALEWHHYAMTYDGTTIRYYGDGVEVDTDEAKSNERDLSIRGDRVHIGSRITQDSSFPGTVDDCRVYNRVLTADEIAALGANPAKIVWVSFHGADDVPSGGAAGAGFTEAPDKGYTDLLKANGYNVLRYVQTKTPDPAILNVADLVIVSRSVASSSFQNDAATTWNSIAAPMIILNGYTARQNRMGYYTGRTIPDTTGDIKLKINDRTHPIFAGISLTDCTMTNPYAGVVTYPDGTTLARGISIVTEPVNAEGTVLAVVSATAAATGPVGATVIAEWPAGATLTHAGGAGTDTLAGPRLLFVTGAREASGISSETAGMYDLYADGAQMLLNAVDYMLNPPPPPPTPPGVNLLVNGGFETGTEDGWGGYGDNTREVVTELVGAAVPESPAEGTYCMHVVVNSAGANFWDGGVQTYQGQVFEAGKQYTFSVWLKCASGTRMINLKPEIAASPWSGYGDQQVTMTDTWAEYSVTTPVFEADVTPTSITLHIQYEPGEFWIDAARFYEGEYAPAEAAE